MGLDDGGGLGRFVRTPPLFAPPRKKRKMGTLLHPRWWLVSVWMVLLACNARTRVERLVHLQNAVLFSLHPSWSSCFRSYATYRSATAHGPSSASAVLAIACNASSLHRVMMIRALALRNRRRVYLHAAGAALMRALSLVCALVCVPLVALLIRRTAVPYGSLPLLVSMGPLPTTGKWSHVLHREWRSTPLANFRLVA